MQLHLHPTRREALTASYSAITRWSLETNPATILAQISNLPESCLPILNSSGCITTSPDGRFFAHEYLTSDTFASPDPRVIEWRTWDDLSPVRRVVVPDTTIGIFSLASSPDGRWLVIGPWYPERIFLLDWHTGKVISHHAVAGNAMTGLAFDPTSTFVAGLTSLPDSWGHCMVFRLDPAERALVRPQGEEWWTRDEPPDQINGNMALSVVHWELDRTGLEWSDRDLADTACQAAFSPDSRLVIFNPMNTAYSGFGLELVAYEVVSGKRLWCARNETENTGPFILSPDGSALLVPVQGGDLLVYRVEDGELVQRLPSGLSKPVQALAFDHDSKTLWLATEETLVQYQPQG